MATKPGLKQNPLQWKRSGFIAFFLAPTLVAFCLFYLYPIVTVFYTSMCKWDYTNLANPQFWGFDEMWNNYKYIFMESWRIPGTGEPGGLPFMGSHRVGHN